MSKEEQPSEESIHHFLDYTWKDIHHSRLQNWTCITVVTVFHIGILKILEFNFSKNIIDPLFLKLLLIAGALYCLVGYLIVMKHQFQLWGRLKWIRKAQHKLSLSTFIDSEYEKPTTTKGKIKVFFRKYFWTAGSLMGLFFFLLLIIDLICAVFYNKIFI